MLLLHGITGVCVCVCVFRERINTGARALEQAQACQYNAKHDDHRELWKMHHNMTLYSLIKTIHAEYHAHNKISYQVLGLEREACTADCVIFIRQFEK